MVKGYDKIPVGIAPDDFRKIYVIYMHLQGIVKTSGTVDIGDQVGTTGGSGNGKEDEYDAHLHYGIFLAEPGLSQSQFDNMSTKPWQKGKSNTSTINPLLFFTPKWYSNGEDGNKPQLV